MPILTKQIKKEVQILLDGEFIREVYYLKWILNMVIMQKVNKKWRMCVNFLNLNLLYLKRIYLLLIIDELIGSTWCLLRHH